METKMPHKTIQTKLINEGTATEEELAKVQEAVEKAIQEALEYALNSPEPKIEEIMDDGTRKNIKIKTGGEKMAEKLYIDALREGLREKCKEMKPYSS